jgi:hypothetical protein
VEAVAGRWLLRCVSSRVSTCERLQPHAATGPGWGSRARRHGELAGRGARRPGAMACCVRAGHSNIGCAVAAGTPLVRLNGPATPSLWNTHTCKHAHVHTDTHTHARNTHTNTCTRTHIHTPTHTCYPLWLPAAAAAPGRRAARGPPAGQDRAAACWWHIAPRSRRAAWSWWFFGGDERGGDNRELG